MLKTSLKAIASWPTWRLVLTGAVATLVFVVFHGYTDRRAVSLLLTLGTLAAVFAIEARRAGSPFVATVSTHGLYNCFVLLLRWS